MNGKLLDTNVIIKFLKGCTELFNLFDDINDKYVSSITVGELLYGAELSAKKDFNIENYKCFCEQLNIINIDNDIVSCYAKIKAQLKKDEKQIPENDIWIAATAMEKNLILVTSDSHFSTIKNLNIENIH